MPHHVSGINFLVLSVNLIPVLLSLFMLLSHLLTLSTIPLSPFITPSLFHSRLKTYPFGRPFVKRFALCYRSVVLSVCLSVTLVYCGQTVGRIKTKLGMQVGLELLFTNLSHRIDSLPVSGLTPRLYDWSVSSEHLGFYF